MKIRTILAPNPGPYTLEGTRCYLLGDDAIVDPGPAIRTHVEALLAAAPNVSKIFITHRHPDHAPAAAALRERTGAAIYAPPAVEPRPDHPLHDGETIALAEGTIEAIATPGHTGEHFCFLTSDGELFTGDTILGEGTTTIFPPDGDMAAYIDSLRKLRARNPRIIYPGHGKIREDAVALIDAYVAHRLERERQVIDALAAGPADVNALRARVYPDLDRVLHRAANLQIEAHLAKLAKEQRVRQTGAIWERA
jgi:glyoxylase-like metal-dependent hydrolase (beta-lactamase superfamily II)